MAVLALILIMRTRGVYTRWLEINIIVCVLALTFVGESCLASASRFGTPLAPIAT